MFISHKNNVIQQVHDTEWQCRRITKGMSKPEYWVWIDSITTDAVADYSGETGYTIVECTDEDVQARLTQLSDYEADYSWVHFSLAMPRSLNEKEVYIYGKFNNYELGEENKMIYNPSLEIYD